VGVLCLLASCAQCASLTVSPENMQGWAMTANKFGLAYLTSGGCVWDETGSGFPSGKGAYYALTTGGGVSTTDKTPDTCWLGLDTLNGTPLAGIRLSQIKTMRYTSYASDMPNYQITEGEWKYPREPICLQFVVQDETGSRRNIWFRPWSYKPQGGGYGGNPADQMGQWITYDCINCTPEFVGPIRTIKPMWSEPISNGQFNSWADVCALYGNETLVPTAAVGEYYHTAGWDGTTTPTGNPTATATGMPLNFEVGARKFQYNGIWGGSGVWFPESINFKGYVDTFTLGVDLNNDGDDADEGEQITYDFEPSADTADPQVVALNLRSICEGDTTTSGSTTHRTGYAVPWDYYKIWAKFRSRLVGQVTNVTQSQEGIYSENGNRFTSVYADFHDGSSNIPVPIQVRIKDPDGTLFEQLQWGGNWIGISGDVRRKPWGLIKMRYVWSCDANTNDLTPYEE
jgi:hypothetical protein